MAAPATSDATERLKELESEIAVLKKAKEAFEGENIKLKKQDEADDKYAKLSKFMQETFGTSPLPFPFFPQPPPAPMDQDIEEEKDPYDEFMEKSQGHNRKTTDGDPLCDAIHPAIVESLHQWFREIHTGTDIQETLKKCERPENCDALKVVTINKEVKDKMSRSDEIKDQRMKWICNAAPKAAWPLATVWNELLRIEFHLQQEQDPSSDVEDAKLPLTLGEPDVNISNIICLLELGIKVIGITSVQAMQKRCHDLQYKLYGAAKELAEFNQKFDNQMFGPKMKADLANILAVNKITTKLTSPSTSHGNNRYNRFLGRGRG